MTRSDLIAELAANTPGLNQADAERVVAAIFEHMVGTLARGGRVELRGFGSFTTKQRKARIGRNPRNGEAVPVAPRAVPFFRASRELVGRLNGRARHAGMSLDE
jgi:integration host factor subunit beta